MSSPILSRLQRWTEAVRQLAKADQREIAAKLTLLLLVLYGEKYWEFTVPLVMFAAVGLIVPRLSTNWVYWLVITAVQARALVPRVYLVDNHKLLMAYWCLALTLSQAKVAEFRLNARLLVGGCFGFAAYWKVTTHEFFDGSFLHFTMLTDARFANFARIAAGIGDGTRAKDAQALWAVSHGLVSHAQLLDSGASVVLAKLSTVWTLFMECGIAICFLTAGIWTPARRFRNWFLIGFVGMTYTIATVIGFAWLLVILGYVQTDDRERIARTSYLALFVGLQLYLVPWGSILR